MSLESFTQKPTPDQSLLKNKETFRQEGLVNIQAAVELASSAPHVDKRVLGFLRESCPDLISILPIPEGENNKTRQSLWRDSSIRESAPYFAVLKSVAELRQTEPLAQSLDDAVKLMIDVKQLERRGGLITPAIIFALAGKAAHLAGDDPLPYFQNALKQSGELMTMLEGERSLNFNQIARFLDDCGYDASHVLERAIQEADKIITDPDADDVSTASQSMAYEDIVGVATRGGYFDIASDAIDRLKSLNEKMGGQFCQDIIAESLAFLGVAQFKESRLESDQVDQ